MERGQLIAVYSIIKKSKWSGLNSASKRALLSDIASLRQLAKDYEEMSSDIAEKLKPEGIDLEDEGAMKRYQADITREILSYLSEDVTAKVATITREEACRMADSNDLTGADMEALMAIIND